jgi:uncharacterized membrane protein
MLEYITYAEKLGLFCVIVFAAAIMIVLILFCWPSDEKLHKERPEDYASEEDFANAVERKAKGLDKGD